MKKTISFEKKIDFPTMIGEITSISLDHNLKFVDESNIEGNFLLTGTYKLTEASRLEDKFNFEIASDIMLNEILDLDTTKIDIEDFYYELENDETMICHIDVKIEGVEKIDEVESIEESIILPTDTFEDTKITSIEMPEATLDEEDLNIIKNNFEESSITKVEKSYNQKEDRECDGDYQNTQQINNMETDNMNEQIEIQEKAIEEGSLFSSFKDAEETFSSYSVYIIREEETLQTLMEKYKTTKEELESYNDLSSITVGSKIILPSKND